MGLVSLTSVMLVEETVTVRSRYIVPRSIAVVSTRARSCFLPDSDYINKVSQPKNDIRPSVGSTSMTGLMNGESA